MQGIHVENFEHQQVVGPTYINDLSCGQAILGVDHSFGSTFFDSFDNPQLNFEREDGLGTKTIEDAHPLWHRKKWSAPGSQTASSHFGAVFQRGIPLQEITIK